MIFLEYYKSRIASLMSEANIARELGKNSEAAKLESEAKNLSAARMRLAQQQSDNNNAKQLLDAS